MAWVVSALKRGLGNLRLFEVVNDVAQRKDIPLRREYQLCTKRQSYQSFLLGV